MTKKKDTAHQRMLSAARRALAIRHAVDQVPRINARLAGIDGVRKRARAVNAPTEEQEERAPYVETDVNDYVNGRRVKIGRAYKRQARFETIEGVTMAQLMALRRYRRAFDTSELSTVKSGLDIGSGGGSSGAWSAISRLETVAFADAHVRRIEQTVPQWALFTLRMVALQDFDFKAVAVERFGNASAWRRQRVRDEFMAAADALANGEPRAAPTAGAATPTAEPAAPAPAIPAEFVDDRGFMKSDAEISALIRASLNDPAEPPTE